MPRRILSLIIMLTALACMLGWSQDTRGTITGRITDPSGAVIPGASVVVTNVAMGSKLTVGTNQDGYYTAPLLMPGTYQVEVTVTGFKKALRDGIEVRVADRLEVNFALEI